MGSMRVVTLRWRERVHPVYAVSVLGFVGVLVSIASRKGQFQPIHRLTMGAVALLLVYSLVVQFLNATKLVLEAGFLRVTHGPLPWRGALRMAREDVRALRCDRNSRRLVLKTAVGEEFVLAENLPESRLGAVDEELRELLEAGPSL